MRFGSGGEVEIIVLSKVWDQAWQLAALSLSHQSLLVWASHTLLKGSGELGSSIHTQVLSLPSSLSNS